MASINASTAGVGGVITTADNTGILNIQTAGTTAVTVNASQNVGVGTASPGGKVTVSGPPTSTSFGNRLTLNLLNTNTSGNQSCQIALGSAGSVVGSVFISSDNAADGTQTGVGTFGASDILRFVTTSAERARIDASGNLLVGTTSDWFGRNIIAEGVGGVAGIVNDITNFSMSCLSTPSSGNNLFAGFWTDSRATPSIRGTIDFNRAGGLVRYNTTSDYRAKTVNGAVENALGKVALLKPSTGRMNGATEDIDFFVAHELQEVVPSAVTGEKDAVKEDGTPDYQMVDKSAIIPLLTAAIQEQQALITNLTSRLEALEGVK
jgi:hypothetical protein